MKVGDDDDESTLSLILDSSAWDLEAEAHKQNHHLVDLGLQSEEEDPYPLFLTCICIHSFA